MPVRFTLQLPCKRLVEQSVVWMTADQQALNHIAGTEQTVEELLLVRVPSMMSSCPGLLSLRSQCRNSTHI
jgi:hypothetical protein